MGVLLVRTNFISMGNFLAIAAGLVVMGGFLSFARSEGTIPVRVCWFSRDDRVRQLRELINHNTQQGRPFTLPKTFSCDLELCGTTYNVIYDEDTSAGPRRIYCPVRGCRTRTLTVNDLENHIFRHEMTREEKKRLRAQSRLYCRPCLQIFTSETTKETHLQSPFHQEREDYELGSGCDLCRRKVKEGHEFSKRHI